MHNSIFTPLVEKESSFLKRELILLAEKHFLVLGGWVSAKNDVFSFFLASQDALEVMFVRD